MTAPPLVELRDVCRRYLDVDALRGVTMQVEPRELVAVVGPSGSGKTTLLQLIGALDRPTSGELLFAGHDVARLGDRELSALRAHRIGFVFQSFHLPTGVPALDIVADGLLYAGVRRDARRERARHCLEQLGLAHRLLHPPHQLSGGERQRVSIARAVIRRPDLLLADEPTGNLDSHAGRALIDLLFQLNAEGTAVVVITHDLVMADRFPRCVHLRDGLVTGDDARVDSGAK